MKKIALFILLGTLGCSQAVVTTSRMKYQDKESGIFYDTFTIHNRTNTDALFTSVCALRYPRDPSVAALFASANQTITEPQYLIRKNKWQRVYERELRTAYGHRNFYLAKTIVPKGQERAFIIATNVLRGEVYYLTCEHFRKELPNGISKRGLE